MAKAKKRCSPSATSRPRPGRARRTRAGRRQAAGRRAGDCLLAPPGLFEDASSRPGSTSAASRYIHLRGLGTPKEGRLAARSGDVRRRCTRIYAKHLKTPQAKEEMDELAALVQQRRAGLPVVLRARPPAVPPQIHRRDHRSARGRRGGESGRAGAVTRGGASPQSSVRRKRVTAIDMAISIRPNSADASYCRLCRVDALEHDGAHDADVMRQRQAFADPLRPVRHAGERKHEAGQQDVRQEEHHRHLHRLQLVLRQGREGVADRQVGGDEQGAERRQQEQVADAPARRTAARRCR